MNNALVSDLLAAGYFISPNNIHSLCGTLMYAGNRGLATPPSGHEVQVLSDRIRVFRSTFFGEQFSGASFWDQVTVAVFTSAADFLDAYRDNTYDTMFPM